MLLAFWSSDRLIGIVGEYRFDTHQLSETVFWQTGKSFFQSFLLFGFVLFGGTLPLQYSTRPTSSLHQLSDFLLHVFAVGLRLRRAICLPDAFFGARTLALFRHDPEWETG